jgi:glyoxylase-like metal-dependent hydrolase (beta-lactamase superfamily II)
MPVAWRIASAVVAMVAFVGNTAATQDAGKVLTEVARTLGAADLTSIQYSGTGFTFSFAQNARPDLPYPKFHATYSRAIDYERGLAREEIVRTQFENPPRGGGGQPLYTDARGAATVTENSGWGAGALALTPHGFVKAAMTANPTMSSRRLGNRPVTVVSFTARNQFTVNGYVNAQNLIERIDTWVANPILGDTLVETTFAGYRAFDGVQFPTRIVQSQGGFPTLDVTVSDVRPNAAVNIQAPPPATPQPARAQGQRIADGIWYLRGTPDPNSQLVEFRDYTVIVESSVSEARALANIAEARRLVPGKPVRYHLNTHHHGDHAAGVRAFASEGATIVTHEMNKRFYEQTVLKSPHTLAPDALSRNPKQANFVWVKDKHVLTDGNRTLEIYHVENGHTANLLMAYIPQEKLLLITDIFNDFGEPRPNDPPRGIVSPYYAALGARIRALKLDVERIAPSHGTGVVSVDVLRKALEGTVQAPPVRQVVKQ